MTRAQMYDELKNDGVELRALGSMKYDELAALYKERFGVDPGADKSATAGGEGDKVGSEDKEKQPQEEEEKGKEGAAPRGGCRHRRPVPHSCPGVFRVRLVRGTETQLLPGQLPSGNPRRVPCSPGIRQQGDLSMTREELAAFVDEYLADHLDKVFWQGLGSETRSASVSMALVDVLAELPGVLLETVSGVVARAIAEQAVFLARNYENINEGKVTTGEGVAGISTSYTLIGDRPGLSFRAISFIKQAKRSIFGGTVRISRG